MLASESYRVMGLTWESNWEPSIPTQLNDENGNLSLRDGMSAVWGKLLDSLLKRHSVGEEVLAATKSGDLRDRRSESDYRISARTCQAGENRSHVSGRINVSVRLPNRDSKYF